MVHVSAPRLSAELDPCFQLHGRGVSVVCARDVIFRSDGSSRYSLFTQYSILQPARGLWGGAKYRDDQDKGLV